MARQVDIAAVLKRVDKALEELRSRRIKAIKKGDIERDEELRAHMLNIDGFMKDIENAVQQLDDYIKKNKLLVGAGLRRAGRRGRPPKERAAKAPARRRGRAKPLPPVGTHLFARYKGKSYFGQITEEGVVVEGIDGVFPTMTAAARAVTGLPNLSGWIFWKTIPPEDTETLEALRSGKARLEGGKETFGVGTRLYGKHGGKDFWAVVTEEGVKVDGIDKVFATPQEAAREILGTDEGAESFWKAISVTGE